MSMRTADPYATLGVPRHASASEVRRAYRRLAKRYHPDVRRDVQATAQMQRINQAWAILSSPTGRARYDATATQGTATTTTHWGGSPRRARPMDPPRHAWAAYGGRRDAEVRDEPGLGRMRWAGLLLLIPAAVLAAALLPTGLLGVPLFGLVFVLIVSTLAGRDD